MFPDKDIDKAFQRLNPPNPEPTPFPLDAWMQLETQLVKEEIQRTVRQKIRRFFAAQVVIVLLAWLLWPGSNKPDTVHTESVVTDTIAPRPRHNNRSNTATHSGRSPWLAKPLRVGTSAASTATTVTTAPALSSAPAPVAAGKSNAAIAAPIGLVAPAGRPSPYTATAPLLATVFSRLNHLRRKTEQPAENLPQIAQRANTAISGTIYRPQATRDADKAMPVTHSSSQNLPAANLLAANIGMDASGAATAPAATRKSGPTAADEVGTTIAGTNSNNAVNQEESTVDQAFAQPVVRGSAVAARSTYSAHTISAATGVENAVVAAITKANDAVVAIKARDIALQAPPMTDLPVELATVAVTPAPPILPSLVRQPCFYLGLVGAPDVSTVKFNSIQRPLTNFGVTLEYRVTNRLRLTTGLLRSTKQYEARREDYDWGAYTSLVYQRNFKQVEGACTVLDVPLNLRYDLSSRPHYRFFANAGLSSFFFQRERYSYYCSDLNAPCGWAGEYVNKNRSLLSILNFSFGYERNLSNHWSLQAEPYLKLPLGGVGQGKIQLTSAGVFFGVKYGL